MEYSDKELKELFEVFQSETDELIQSLFEKLSKLENNLDNKELLIDIFRDVHGLKGAVRMIGFENIQNLIHLIEDIISGVKDNLIPLSVNLVLDINGTLELVADYIKESINRKKEYIDIRYNDATEKLQKINQTQLLHFDINETAPAAPNTGSFNDEEIRPETIMPLSVQDHINSLFANAFEILDAIVPEVVSDEIRDLFLIIDELYNCFQGKEFYEVKAPLESVKVKLEFVQSSSCELTISEILEIRNNLGIATSKYTSFCMDSQNVVSFPEIAEKIYSLQNNNIYISEIIDELNQIKSINTDQTVTEIISIVIDILNFIKDNDITLEEQMVMTLKNSVESCATSDDNVDVELILQQLEITKQLLELDYKKDIGIIETKGFSAKSQTNTSNAGTNNEIKNLHVNSAKLDMLINQLGELIITKIKTEKHLDKIDSIRSSSELWQKDLIKAINHLKYYHRKYLQVNSVDQFSINFVKQIFMLLSEVSQNLSKTIYDLTSLSRVTKEDDMKMRLIIDEMESMVKNIRVLPISTVLHSFSRMVRDIANEKNKQIEFVIEDNDTSADKKIVEEIKTPLIHILRNAIDHGIEHPEERRAKGKNPMGKIMLCARQDDNKVILDVIDDGQGFNLNKIKDRALSHGFLTQEEIDAMSDEEIMNIIFWPGFTTGDSITSISGRGIGLDVVKTKISQLNGKVKIISEFGKGSCVHIEIPVTMTTLRVFLVKVSNQTFAIPIQVISTFILKQFEEISSNNGNLSIQHNGEIIPVYYLSDILKLQSTERREKEIILIIESEQKKIGLIVDALFGDQDILQKKLAPPLYKVKNISGITNLASGELCLILNIQEMVKNIGTQADINSAPKVLTSDILSFKRILVVDDSLTTRTMEKNILKAAGYITDEADDPFDAFNKLKLNHYDLIVSDISMPKMDGLEFLTRLKNDEMYADIPVVIVSSMVDKDISKQALALGAETCIAKNDFYQKSFLDIIAKLLMKHHN